MTHQRLSALLIAALSAAAAVPAWAVGSTASSATSGASASVGASSNSLQTSSNSSSKGTEEVAAGDYKVIEVAGAGGAGGADDSTRLTLQALSGADNADGADPRQQFVLVLPTGVVARTGLTAGSIVTARQRPYGMEFAAGPERQAFFLVLADEWYRELNSTAVVL